MRKRRCPVKNTSKIPASRIGVFCQYPPLNFHGPYKKMVNAIFKGHRLTDFRKLAKNQIKRN